MGTDVGTERSKHSDLIEWYPSLLHNQYYLPVNLEIPYQSEQDILISESKDQRHRKSTPIRGEN